MSGVVDKDLIPPQLCSYWSSVLDSDDRATYVVYDIEHGVIKEQLNFCVMKFSFGKVLVSMPYMGYGCCFSAGNEQHAKDIFTALTRFAREEGCLSMTVCTHPLATLPIESTRSIFDYDFQRSNFCQVSELDAHPFNKMNHHRRMAFQNESSKLHKRCPAAFIDPAPSEDVFAEWFDVYKSRYNDLGGAAFPDWFFYNYYQASKMTDDIEFCVVRTDDEVLGGVFFAVGKGIVDYGTSAFTTASRDLSPTTHLLDLAFHHFMFRGVRYFNWQSSPEIDGGVFNYKKQWGALTKTHYYLIKLLAGVGEITSTPLDVVKKEAAGCYILPYEMWDNE